MSRRIQPDKWKHFFVGIAMGAFLQIAALYTLPWSRMVSAAVTLAVVIAISYGFELYSRITGHGHHELLDAVASIIGGVLGMVLVLLIM